MSPRCPVIVLAKAPVAGFAKSRLVPALGVGAAAHLAERLLERAIEQACQAGIGPVELRCAPDCTHTAFVRMAQQHGVALSPQGDGDLGARMWRALAAALALHGRALLIGTDTPALDAAYLRQASEALAEHDAVFGPATDGGYTLVGLRTPAPSLFDEMPWSTPQVMRQTRERLARLGLRHTELATLSDVDEAVDLQHVPREWLA